MTPKLRPEFYAFRVYKKGKRQEEWRINRGLYNTGPGHLITTKELEEDWEPGFVVERVNKKLRRKIR